MWILIMIVALSGQGKAVSTSSNYYDNEGVCKAAANDFESHKSKDLILKAFCIRGD